MPAASGLRAGSPLGERAGLRPRSTARRYGAVVTHGDLAALLHRQGPTSDDFASTRAFDSPATLRISVATALDEHPSNQQDCVTSAVRFAGHVNSGIAAVLRLSTSLDRGRQRAMRSKLLLAALSIIAAFAIADLARAAAATLATFMASAAVPREVVSEAIVPPPPIPTRRASLASFDAN
jgi:hypothetical protein